MIASVHYSRGHYPGVAVKSGPRSVFANYIRINAGLVLEVQL